MEGATSTALRLLGVSPEEATQATSGSWDINCSKTCDSQMVTGLMVWPHREPWASQKPSELLDKAKHATQSICTNIVS